MLIVVKLIIVYIVTPCKYIFDLISFPSTSWNFFFKTNIEIYLNIKY